jgi:hypothetical protein
MDGGDAGRGVLALMAVRFFLAGLATGWSCPAVSAASSSTVSPQMIPATRRAKSMESWCSRSSSGVGIVWFSW